MSNAEEEHEKRLAAIRAKYEAEMAALADLTTHPDVEPPVQLETGYDAFVYVDNIPKVSSDKLTKLRSVLESKVLAKVGALAADGLYLPVDAATGMSLGFCIVEYADKESAQKAVKYLDGLKLDAGHTFKVNAYNDVVAADKVEDTFNVAQVKIAERPLLKHWLLDPRGIDQLMLFAGERLDIVWNSIDYRLGWNDPAQKELEPYVVRDRFPMMFAAWSPSGTFLATVHGPGVAIWGGPPENWERVQKLDHKGASRLAFSPSEKYLVTLSLGKPSKKQAPEDAPRTAIIHSMDTGRRIKVFEGLNSPEWPLFKFSPDDAWFAGLGKDKIRVFDTATMELQGKPIKVPGVQALEVSPGGPLLAYFVPEKENSPAAVTIIELPSRRIVAQKNMFKVRTCSLYWHPSGDYLCAKVERDNKTGKKQFTMLVLFRVSEKGVPVELVEYDTETVVTAFAWQPSGKRFAVVHGPPTASAKPDVSIHSMSGAQVSLEKTFTQRACNTLLWAPTEPYLVLANHKQAGGGGALEFINAVLLETMGTGDAPTATAYYWDPRSRFFCTVSSAWRHNMETGFFMFSFNGKLLLKHYQDRFYDLAWRPRPPSLLSAQEEKQVKKLMKKYAEQFHKEDEMRQRLEKRDFYEGRTKARAAFYARMEAARAALGSEARTPPTEHDYTTVKETRQEIIEETVEVY